MPKRFGYGFEDLPEGALGFPELILDEEIKWDELEPEVEDGNSTDDPRGEQCD